MHRRCRHVSVHYQDLHQGCSASSAKLPARSGWTRKEMSKTFQVIRCVRDTNAIFCGGRVGSSHVRDKKTLPVRSRSRQRQNNEGFASCAGERWRELAPYSAQIIFSDIRPKSPQEASGASERAYAPQASASPTPNMTPKRADEGAGHFFGWAGLAGPGWFSHKAFCSTSGLHPPSPDPFASNCSLGPPKSSSSEISNPAGLDFQEVRANPEPKPQTAASHRPFGPVGIRQTLLHERMWALPWPPATLRKNPRVVYCNILHTVYMSGEDGLKASIQKASCHGPRTLNSWILLSVVQICRFFLYSTLASSAS